MRGFQRPVILFVLFLATICTLWPSVAHAQRFRPGRGRYVRSVVFVGGYYSPFFAPYYPYYPYYWYPPSFYGPYDYYQGRYDYSGSLRIQAAPRQTEVYVDGYYAGTVDDYDGFLQRLHLSSGGHEIVLRLEGHRSYRETVYLRPGSTQRIHHTMERLGPGETTEPPPQPSNPPATQGPPPERGRGMPAPPRGGGIGPDMPPPPRGGERVDADRFGTLSIRVQPASADVLIDGERWRGPGVEDRLVVQLGEGRHRIEIQKDGYEKFSTEVQIRRGETTPLNVSLLRLLLETIGGK